MSKAPEAGQILAGLPDAVLVIDNENRITRVNPAAENLFRTSATKMITQTLQSILSFDSARLNETLHDVQANLAAHNVMASLRGNPVPVDFYVGILPSAPDWRIVGLQAKSEILDEAIGDNGTGNHFGINAPDVLGHEIKNPLAAIRGAAQLLARSSDDRAKVHTGMIISEVDRIANLMERMQSLSTNKPVTVQAINIHALIDQARDSIQTASQLPVEISDSFDPSLPNVLADPEAMMQILANLLSNAIAAVKSEDHPKVDVITRFSFGGMISTKDAQKPVRLPIEVIVQDNGPGVPPNLKNDIFAPFITTKAEGQGLGLALVKKLVGDMHGRIRHERLREAGLTQFTLFLPMAEQG